MTVRRTVVMVLAVLAALAGCGTAPQPDPAPAPAPAPRPAEGGVVRVDPVLVPALEGAEPKAAKDPVALARQLVVAETAVRDPKSAPALVAAAGRTAQVAYRALQDRPGWDAAVLARVPAALRPAVRTTTAAGRDLQSMVTRPPDTLPPWRIVDPLPADRLRGYYLEAQRRFGVPWTVLAAINLVETGSGRIVGLSPAGAKGPMQFVPGTWARYGLGGDVWNPRDAILGAANYLAANGGADRTNAGLDEALYHYNNDIRYVRAVRGYADVIAGNERAFLGLHARQIYYRTRSGDVLLPTGYASARPIPVQDWLARRPR